MPEAKASPTSYSFEAIGTSWAIESAGAISNETRGAIDIVVRGFDRFWSRFRTDSVISEISRTAGQYQLPPEATRLFKLYGDLYALSRGLVTPLVGRALEHWGYDRAYSLTPSPGVPEPIPAWSDALSVNDGVLSVPRPVLIDIGAAGKGLLVDMICDALLDDSHDEFLVDASGDLRRETRGSTTERVGLENPHNPTKAIGVAEIGCGSIAGSGTNRRRWSETHHHVLDGLTGLPSVGVSASWAVAPSAMVADGFATALLLVEPEALAGYEDVEWVIMTDNGQVRHSPRFPGEIFA